MRLDIQKMAKVQELISFAISSAYSRSMVLHPPLAENPVLYSHLAGILLWIATDSMLIEIQARRTKSRQMDRGDEERTPGPQQDQG